MLYFAYGSNMHTRQMASRCPGARARGAARLPGYRLSFTYESRSWGGGVGTVVPDGTDEVWGVLWDLDDEHVRTLDRYEGVGQGIYRKEEMDVLRGDEPVRALVYVCNTDGWRRPSRRYLGALVEAAVEHGFPAPYVERLRAGRERSAIMNG